MDFFQFSAPAGWLLVDFGLGLIVLLGYTLIPSVYRPLAHYPLDYTALSGITDRRYFATPDGVVWN
ncbi:MAG: hypothetical protein R2932_20165 [Caldilineaceae bacterium]